MSQVVSVISGKGGTGKTSLCAGISSCLAAEGSQVLCIDADVGLRNLDLSLGMSAANILWAALRRIRRSRICIC